MDIHNCTAAFSIRAESETEILRVLKIDLIISDRHIRLHFNSHTLLIVTVDVKSCIIISCVLDPADAELHMAEIFNVIVYGAISRDSTCIKYNSLIIGASVHIILVSLR